MSDTVPAKGRMKKGSGMLLPVVTRQLNAMVHLSHSETVVAGITNRFCAIHACDPAINHHRTNERIEYTSTGRF